MKSARTLLTNPDLGSREAGDLSPTKVRRLKTGISICGQSLAQQGPHNTVGAVATGMERSAYIHLTFRVLVHLQGQTMSKSVGNLSQG
jgi:hypothetical protein